MNTERISLMEQLPQTLKPSNPQNSPLKPSNPQTLKPYLGSPEWHNDRNDDAAGRLPQGLKRGVLSEDAIWNLLEHNRELK